MRDVRSLVDVGADGSLYGEEGLARISRQDSVSSQSRDVRVIRKTFSGLPLSSALRLTPQHLCSVACLAPEGSSRTL